MHTMYVPIVLCYVRSILLVSCIFCQKERIYHTAFTFFTHSHTHLSSIQPKTFSLDQRLLIPPGGKTTFPGPN